MTPLPPASANRIAVLSGGGPAAIAIVRLRGHAVPEFLQRQTRFPTFTQNSSTAGRTLRGALLDEGGEPLDDILLTIHDGPPAWDVRLHLHGNPWLVQRCLDLASGLGFLQESPSLWRGADGLETDALNAAPLMTTTAGAEWLLDQARTLREELLALRERLAAPRDEPTPPRDAPTVWAESIARMEAIIARAQRFDWYARPARIALLGPPNAGKSTLMNALVERSVSLVSSVAGTTRDWVEAPSEVRGFPVTWLDTAGVRDSEDPLEREGVRRSLELARSADATIVLLDATRDRQDHLAFLRLYPQLTPACIALNKVDLLPPRQREELHAALARGEFATRHDDKTARMAETNEPTARGDLFVRAGPDPSPPIRAIFLSAQQREGLEDLENALLEGMKRTVPDLAAPSAFAARQTACLHTAIGACRREDLQATLEAIDAGLRSETQPGVPIPRSSGRPSVADVP